MELSAEDAMALLELFQSPAWPVLHRYAAHEAGVTRHYLTSPENTKAIEDVRLLQGSLSAYEDFLPNLSELYEQKIRELQALKETNNTD